MNARASVSASGWGASASASIASENSVKYQSNQVKIVAYRDLTYGIDGLVTGDYPPFSDQARDMLCSNPDAFTAEYGTHFIKGKLTGASIDMMMTVTTTNSNSANKFSASLSAKGSYGGVSGKASASIEGAVKKSKEVKDTQVTVTVRGGDRGVDVVKNMEMDQAISSILNFGKVSS